MWGAMRRMTFESGVSGMIGASGLPGRTNLMKSASPTCFGSHSEIGYGIIFHIILCGAFILSRRTAPIFPIPETNPEIPDTKVFLSSGFLMNFKLQLIANG